MTLRIPDDLAGLRELEAGFGNAPVFVIRAPAPDEEWDGLELPILDVELNPHKRYFEVHTAVPAVGRTPSGALTLSALLDRLEAFGTESRELFWVSSLRPLAPETDPELSRYSVRLALPLQRVATADEPPSVAFVARSEGLGPAAQRTV